MVSFTYELCDLLCGLRIDGVQLAMVFHHVATMCGLGSGLLHGNSGFELVLALVITQASSPFLNIKGIVQVLGLKGAYPVFETANDILFCTTFLLFRLGATPVNTVHTVIPPRTSLTVKLAAMGIAGVSFYWARTILKMMVRSCVRAGMGPKAL